jgi:3-keto-disaccharide hydrolase
MRTQRLSRLLVCLLFVSTVAAQTRESAEFDPAPEAPWVKLFDGRSLNGWRQACGDGGFRVADGAIIGRSGRTYPHSYLVTERRWGDFLLEFEFRAATSLNAGLQLRSRTRPLENGVDVIGYQVEIDTSARGWTGGIFEQGLRGWLARPRDEGAARRALRPGDWNRVRVLARGARLRTWINGVATADLLDASVMTGFVGLQVHAVDQGPPREIHWRGLRLKPLTRPQVQIWRTDTTSDWIQHGDGLRVVPSAEGMKLRLDDPTLGPAFLEARGQARDGAWILRFRMRRGGLHLVLGAQNPDWQGGRGGLECALEPPMSGTLWRPKAKPVTFLRAPIIAASREEASLPHELVIVRQGRRLVARLDGEALHQGEILLSEDEARGPVWGLHFPASRRPVIDLVSARFIAAAPTGP